MKIYIIILLIQIVLAKKACKPNWTNNCIRNSQCCSKVCYLEPGWDIGVCTPGDGNCKPLWNTRCTKNDDCCSLFCDKNPLRPFGTCKNRTSHHHNTTVNMVFLTMNHNNTHGSNNTSNHGRNLISYHQFIKALITNDFESPSMRMYNGFINSADFAGIENRNELARYLALLMFKSDGFRFREDPHFADFTMNPDNIESDPSRPDKSYHGRGYLMLTNASNYRSASKDIFGDQNILLDNPEKVADEEWLAFTSAGWLWIVKVIGSGAHNGDLVNSINAIDPMVDNDGLKQIRNYYRNNLIAFNTH